MIDENKVSANENLIKDADEALLERGDSVVFTDEMQSNDTQYRNLGIGKVNQIWPTCVGIQVLFRTTTHSISFGFDSGKYFRKVSAI
jgi:hypothetical protein